MKSFVLGVATAAALAGVVALSRSESTGQNKAPADPELLRQLDAAGADQPVIASFTLCPSKGDVMAAQEVHQKVDEVVKSAEEKAGQKIKDINVMANAQSFVLEAPPEVIRAVLGSKAIASAIANEQPESMAIEPVPRPTPKGGGGGKKKRKGKS